MPAVLKNIPAFCADVIACIFVALTFNVGGLVFETVSVFINAIEAAFKIVVVVFTSVVVVINDVC